MDVWEKLDPSAGLSRSPGKWRFALSTILLPIALALFWQSGAIRPHLSQGPVAGSSSSIDLDELGRPRYAETDLDLTLVNDGWLPVTITAVVPATRDLVLKRHAAALPLTLGPGESAKIPMTLEVRGCPSSGGGPFYVEVERWWGTVGVTVPDHEEDLSPIHYCD